jgi:hypothetical protein
MIIEVKLGNVLVRNVTSITWGANRPPNSKGTLGQNVHNIDVLTIRRNKALESTEDAKSETEVIALAAELEKKAYFKGVIQIKDHSRAGNVLQKIEWDKGHICSLENVIMENSIEEVIKVATTNLKVDNSEFKLQLEPQPA